MVWRGLATFKQTHNYHQILILDNCHQCPASPLLHETLTLFHLPFSESSQQLCSQSLSVRTERSQIEKTSSGLTPADKAANAPVQQQISAAEQKSRMDLQMSTALHGSVASHTCQNKTPPALMLLLLFVFLFHVSLTLVLSEPTWRQPVCSERGNMTDAFVGQISYEVFRKV